MVKESNWLIAEANTDDLATHVMLFRLLAVQPNSHLFIDGGNPYATLSYEYWRKCLRVKTDSVTKRSLNKLRKKGIVQTLRKKMYGEVRLHIRLSIYFTEKYDVKVQNEPTVDSDGTTGLVQNELTQGSKMNQSYIKKNNKENNSIKQSAKKIRKEILGSSETVLEDKKPTFDNARKVWSVYWHKYQDGPVDGFPTSPKIRKMFRDWVNKVPEDEIPLHLIARAVQHWSEFRDEVKSDTGKSVPDYPTLAHVLWNLPCLLRISPHAGEPVKQTVAVLINPSGKLTADQIMDMEIAAEAEGNSQ